MSNITEITPIVGVFFAVFHPNEGTKVLHQVPEDLVDNTTFGTLLSKPKKQNDDIYDTSFNSSGSALDDHSTYLDLDDALSGAHTARGIDDRSEYELDNENGTDGEMDHDNENDNEDNDNEDNNNNGNDNNDSSNNEGDENNNKNDTGNGNGSNINNMSTNVSISEKNSHGNSNGKTNEHHTHIEIENDDADDVGTDNGTEVTGRKFDSEYSEYSDDETNSLSDSKRIKLEDVKNHIIPKSEFCNKLLSVKSRKYKIIGFPVNIQSSFYARNSFKFNFCFVFEYDKDSTMYELIIKRLGKMFKVLEEQSQILSKSSNDLSFFNKESEDYQQFIKKDDFSVISYKILNTFRPKNAHLIDKFNQLDLLDKEDDFSINSLINELYQDLNYYSECSIKINAGNSIEIKLFPNKTVPDIEILPCDVPISTVDLLSIVDDLWDPNLMEAAMYIDGINNVYEISRLCDSDFTYTCDCIKTLMAYKCIILLDTFAFSNTYATTPKVSDFLKHKILSDECKRYIFNEKNPFKKFTDNNAVNTKSGKSSTNDGENGTSSNIINSAVSDDNDNGSSNGKSHALNGNNSNGTSSNSDEIDGKGSATRDSDGRANGDKEAVNGSNGNSTNIANKNGNSSRSASNRRDNDIESGNAVDNITQSYGTESSSSYNNHNKERASILVNKKNGTDSNKKSKSAGVSFDDSSFQSSVSKHNTQGNFKGSNIGHNSNGNGINSNNESSGVGDNKDSVVLNSLSSIQRYGANMSTDSLTQSGSTNRNYYDKGFYPLSTIQLFKLYLSFKQGITVDKWTLDNEHLLKVHNIDLRRFITYGLLQGLLYRIYSYPVLDDYSSKWLSKCSVFYLVGDEYKIDSNAVYVELEAKLELKSSEEAKKWLEAINNIHNLKPITKDEIRAMKRTTKPYRTTVFHKPGSNRDVKKGTTAANVVSANINNHFTTTVGNRIKLQKFKSPKYAKLIKGMGNDNYYSLVAILNLKKSYLDKVKHFDHICTEFQVSRKDLERVLKTFWKYHVVEK